MNIKIIILLTILLTQLSAAFAQGLKTMDQIIAENSEVIARMQAHGMNLAIPYPVEFIAVFPSEEAADKVALMYVSDAKAGEKLQNIETRPDEEGGMELLLIKSMFVTAKGIAEFETQLNERAKGQGGYVDGWGVMQE